MNNLTAQKNNLSPAHTTSERLLARIEAEAITPTAKITFRLTEWGIWFLWTLTVLFGAVALAVSGYVTLSAQYALYEATHENFFTFFVSVMPIIWVGLFALMTYISVFEIKKTRHGYRYHTNMILGSNLLFTVGGALLLHSFGLGYALDHKLGQQIGLYMSMDKMEQQLWQNPNEGRLVGVLLPGTDPDTSIASQVLNFKDSTGTLWRLNADELSERELKLLLGLSPVRTIGTTTSQFSFHVCGIFPVFAGQARGRSELLAGRREFDALMHEKMRKMEQWANEIKETEIENQPTEHLCDRLPMMKRLQ